MAKETTTGITNTGIVNAALSEGGVGPMAKYPAANYPDYAPDLSQETIEIIGGATQSSVNRVNSPAQAPDISELNFSVLTGPSLSRSAAAVMDQLPRLAQAGSIQNAAIELAKRGVGGPLETLIVMARAGGGQPE